MRRRLSVGKRVLVILAGVLAAMAMTASPAAPAGVDVAICSTNVDDYDLDVQSKLVATALFSTVDLLDCGSTTPSLATFQAYAAVLAYGDSDFADASALAINLRDYVDGGGHLVVAVFSFNDDGGLDFSGTVLETGGYLPFAPGPQGGDPGLTLVADDSGSPLLAGVSSFNGGFSGYRADVSLAAGATLAAHWSDGGSTPLVASKGNVVGLNFYPPSSDVRGDFWDATTDGVRLLTNALGATATGGGRAGYCAVAGNTAPNSGAPIAPGTFLDLATEQPATDSHYTGALAANFYQGLGISCDSLPGYTRTGELVGSGGHGDPGGYTYWARN